MIAPHTKNAPLELEPADRGFIEHGLRELARNAPKADNAGRSRSTLPELRARLAPELTPE